MLCVDRLCEFCPAIFFFLLEERYYYDALRARIPIKLAFYAIYFDYSEKVYFYFFEISTSARTVSFIC